MVQSVYRHLGWNARRKRQHERGKLRHQSDQRHDLQYPVRILGRRHDLGNRIRVNQSNGIVGRNSEQPNPIRRLGTPSVDESVRQRGYVLFEKVSRRTIRKHRKRRTLVRIQSRNGHVPIALPNFGRRRMELSSELVRLGFHGKSDGYAGLRVLYPHRPCRWQGIERTGHPLRVGSPASESVNRIPGNPERPGITLENPRLRRRGFSYDRKSELTYPSGSGGRGSSPIETHPDGTQEDGDAGRGTLSESFGSGFAFLHFGYAEQARNGPRREVFTFITPSPHSSHVAHPCRFWSSAMSSLPCPSPRASLGRSLDVLHSG